VAVSCGGCSPVYVTEARLLRPVPDTGSFAFGATQAESGTGITEHVITLPDGTRLHSVVVEPPNASHTVLYFGGNMFRISTMGAEAIRRLAPLGVRVVLVDHRGFGRSTGQSPTLRQLESDAVAVYDSVLRFRGVDQSTLIVHGHSLGSFLAGEVAEERAVAGVVLECSATTGAEWIRAADRRPWYVRLFTRLEVEPALATAGNLARVHRLASPLLILVGSEDRVTPPGLSQTLLAAANLPDSLKSLHVLPGADHNNVTAHPDFPTVYRAFLSRIGSRADKTGKVPR
jgi:hypothetical protein